MWIGALYAIFLANHKKARKPSPKSFNTLWDHDFFLLFCPTHVVHSSCTLHTPTPTHLTRRLIRIYKKTVPKENLYWKKTKLFCFRWNWDKDEKNARHPSVDFLLQSPIGGGGKDFVDSYLGEDALDRWDNWFCEYSILKNKFLYISFTLFFKGIVSRDSIFTTFIKFCKVTPVHSCGRWCFALKGQCHKIFCYRFFFMNHFPTSLWNYH